MGPVPERPEFARPFLEGVSGSFSALWDSCAQGLQNMTVNPGPLLLGKLNTALRGIERKEKDRARKEEREESLCLGKP